MPDGDRSTILTVGVDQERVHVMQHRLDHAANAANPRGPQPGEPPKRAAMYRTKAMTPGERRPKLEKLIRRAAKRPRPFDEVIVYSRWVLGNERQQEDAISRHAEHGVSVTFVDENPPTDDARSRHAPSSAPHAPICPAGPGRGL